MFNKAQEEYLIRRFNRNDVVLFTGAGFSYDAYNLLGENFPIGSSLTKKMFEFIYPGENYVEDGTKLQDMYQALVTSGKSHDQIKEFLRQNLNVKNFPDYYKFLTYPFWYKIYTINIDNLIDKIYDRWGTEARVENLIFPFAEFKERDQLLDYLQAIYLHGKIPCNPNDVIFSRSQYASTSIKLQPLYFHFIQDFSTLPTIFIGTTLDEQLFEQYIATRQSIREGIPENRPKSFLVIPDIPVVREKILKDLYNIEVVKGTTEQFLTWIGQKSAELLAKQEILNKTFPTLEKLENNPRYRDHYSHGVREFAQSFQKVEINKKFTSKKKDFLLGTTPTWSDIHFELDAPRDITRTLFKNVENFFNTDSDLHTIAILGNAGSGKSTVLKRLCFDLVKAGRSVYFSHSENLPKLSDFVETIEMLNERVIIAIDNAELVLRQLVEIANELNKIKFPPVFILGSRTNIFDRISSNYEPLVNLVQYEMHDLSRNEIKGIINKLDENNLLGVIKGVSDDQRIKLFEHKAKKQILVAMREVTQGEDFDVILKSEFDEINSEEGKLLCLCVCLSTDAGFTISRQDYTSFSAKTPAESLDILERGLKGLVLKVGVKDDRLMIRHRMIAKFLIETCVNPEMLKQAYIRVLSSLASEINSRTKDSRKFDLYKEIINHAMIYKRFAKDIDKAREVYDSLTDYFTDDYQLWLQYGSLELEGNGGNIGVAENYINQAQSLNDVPIVRKTLANLYYKKALLLSSKIEAISLKEKADEILIKLMSNRLYNDQPSYHIYAKGNYNWIIHWVNGKQAIKESLQELHNTVKRGCELFPANKSFQYLDSIVTKAILLTAVNSESVTYPILYSELEK